MKYYAECGNEFDEVCNNDFCTVVQEVVPFAVKRKQITFWILWSVISAFIPALLSLPIFKNIIPLSNDSVSMAIFLVCLGLSFFGIIRFFIKIYSYKDLEPNAFLRKAKNVFAKFGFRSSTPDYLVIETSSDIGAGFGIFSLFIIGLPILIALVIVSVSTYTVLPTVIQIYSLAHKEKKGSLTSDKLRRSNKAVLVISILTPILLTVIPFFFI